MSDWQDMIRRVREGRPLRLVCDGCGEREWDRGDMLEAYFPDVHVELNGVDISPLTLGWVGPCCASMANTWQPGDPE